MTPIQTILTATTGITLLMVIPAHADGLTTALSDPKVMAPRQEWTGLYIGLSYGHLGTKRTETTSTTTDVVTTEEVTTTEDRCFKLGQPKACDDPIFLQYPDFKVIETVTTTETITTVTPVTTISTAIIKEADNPAGAFIGYRHDFGRVVGGVELGVLGDLTSAELQLGADLGLVMLYGLAGAGDFNGESGELFGLGADVQVGKRMMLGVKYTSGGFGGTDVEAVSARVGLRF
ncbi:MAG: hypothetical protein ACRC6I_01850 [Paracoccaceae bacterium]